LKQRLGRGGRTPRTRTEEQRREDGGRTEGTGGREERAKGRGKGEGERAKEWCVVDIVVRRFYDANVMKGCRGNVPTDGPIAYAEGQTS